MEPQPKVPVPRFPPVGDFPLEQSRDATLRSAYDEVIAIDGTWVQPDVVLTLGRHPIAGAKEPPGNYFPGGVL